MCIEPNIPRPVEEKFEFEFMLLFFISSAKIHWRVCNM